MMKTVIALDELKRMVNGAIAQIRAQHAYLSAAGAIATKEMRARMGRAKNLGERTIGHQTTGATSIALILKGFWEGLSQ